MNEFRPIQYIKKYAAWLVGFFALLTVLLYAALNAGQSYTAVTILNYLYDGADEGLAPDGTPMDVSEIYSSNVISQALSNLRLDLNQYPIDSVRAAISVNQIEDEAVTAVNQAKNEGGETSTLQSTKYSVTYQASGSAGPEFARQLLDEIIDVYFTQFSKKYINTSSVENSVSMINQSVYDYIEQMELVDSALEKTITNLKSRASSDATFYSAATGYSFGDLVDQFQLLKDTQISALNAYILRHQVTQDKGVLLDKYAQRLQNYEFEQQRNKARVSEVEGIINTYVEKLRESNNTAQSQVITEDGTETKNNNVLGDVESPNTDVNGSGSAADQTTEYDQLLQNWINISDTYNRSVINSAYAQYVIDCFSGNSDAVINYQMQVSQITNQSGDDTPLGVDGEFVDADAIQEQMSSDVYTEATIPCTEEDIAYVEQGIDSVIEKMNELYSLVALTDAEYNEYLGAEYIQMLSSIYVEPKLNVPLYTLLGAVLFLGVGCIGVIFVGRVGDIIEYIAFTDHQYRLPNRGACDRYIGRFKDKILPIGYGVMMLQVLNQNELNQSLGRRGADEVLAFFASSLKNIFAGEKQAFIGYNGSGQFMVFVSRTSEMEMKEIASHFQAVLSDRLSNQNVLLQYALGFDTVSSDHPTHLRTLISGATKKKEKYEAGVLKEV